MSWKDNEKRGMYVSLLSQGKLCLSVLVLANKTCIMGNQVQNEAKQDAKFHLQLAQNHHMHWQHTHLHEQTKNTSIDLLQIIILVYALRSTVQYVFNNIHLIHKQKLA